MMRYKLLDPDPAPNAPAPSAPPAAPPPAPAPTQSAPPAPAPAPKPNGGPPPPPTPLGKPGDPPAPAADPAVDWPEDWREVYAGQDVKKLNQLRRYASPRAMMDGLFAAKERISRGDIGKALGDNATEDEVKEYREMLGIPDKPENYKLELKENRQIDENSKPSIDFVLNEMHKMHMPPKVVNGVVNTLFALNEREEKDREQSDVKAIRDFELALRPEWGPDYKRNLNVAKTFLEQAPNGVGKALMNARLPDGVPVASSPDVVRWLVDMALAANPLASVVPNVGGDALNMVRDEIAKLEGMMGNHDSEYWKGANAERNQNRYRELIAARDKANAAGR